MSYTLVVLLVLTAFAFKIFAISGLSTSLRKYATSSLDAWLGSWVIIQCATICFMLIASAFGSLNLPVIWAWLAIIALALGLKGLPIQRAKAVISRFELWHAPFVLILILIGLRALSFFDYTGDAYAYGYTRIAIWMNYQSLFIHMPTPQINIFTNEWNGELVSLLYGLAANDLQGLTFGNFEVLLVLFLSVLRLCLILGCRARFALFISLAITSTPACLGLAATIKGDLLACVGVVLAAAWIVEKRDHTRHFAYTIALPIAALGLAAGSKISSAVACAVLAIALLRGILPLLTSRATWLALLAGTTLASVFCARYFINIAIYGDPLNRAADEGVKAGLDSFTGNLVTIANRWFSFFPTLPPFQVWALSGGLGLTGLAVTAYLFLVLIERPAFTIAKHREAATGLALGLCALLLSMALIGPKDWSLRYFLPAICLMLPAIFSFATSSLARKISYALPVLAIGNFAMSLQPGEIVPNFPNLTPLSNWAAIGSMTSVQRALLFHPGTYHVFRIEELGLDQDGPGKSVAILAEINVFLFELVGARAQNRLILTETPLDLEKALYQNPDLIMVTRRDASLPHEVREIISRFGYSIDSPSQAGDSTLWVAKR